MTYSIGARQAYIDRGWPADRVFAAPNALDLEAIERTRQQTLANPEALNVFRKSKSIGNGPLALFVARLDAQRRVDILLETISQLRGDFPTLQLAIIGEGPARKELELQSARLGLVDRLQFAGAVYDEAELAKWFCSASLFAFPSFMGLSALHALAYGVPIVTGNDRWSHGPEVEAVIEGETGLLFKHNDPAAMASAMRRLLTDHELEMRMSRRGREVAREHYSMPAMIAAFESAIRAARRFAIA